MEELLAQIKEGWLYVAGFAGGLVAWGRTASNVSHLQEARREHDERIKTCEEAVKGMQISAAAIETHQQHIAKSVETLVDEVRKLREQ